MPWTLDYSTGDRILTARCEGDFTAADLDHVTRACVDKLHERRALRVLLDFSTAIVNFNVIELYALPETYAEIRAPRLTHIAIIVPASGYRVDVFQFYEDMAVNRGYFAKLFDKEKQARDWLLSFKDQ